MTSILYGNVEPANGMQIMYNVTELDKYWLNTKLNANCELAKILQIRYKVIAFD